MKSDAATVDEYLAELPDDRRDVLSRVRKAVNAHLPAGFEEVMQYGMISWVVPLRRYPDTYIGEALAVASLASQKNHMALYLLGVYGDESSRAWLEEQWVAAGLRLDMCKSCLRFKRLQDVDLGLIGQAIARTSVDDFIDQYEQARA